MQLQVTQKDQKIVDPINLSDDVFSCPFNEGMIHQVVMAYMAAGRAGTKAQKTRSEVSGGGRKPWKQKGSGRARAGTIRSPLWRTGGVTFAAKPRDYTQKVNRKVYRKAIKSILSELIRQERLLLIDDLKIEAPKTKLLLEAIKSYQIKKLLILIEGEDNHLALAARNLSHIEILDVNRIDPVRLLACEKVVATVAAIKKLEERLL